VVEEEDSRDNGAGPKFIRGKGVGDGLTEVVGEREAQGRAGQGQRDLKLPTKDSGLSAWRTGIMGRRVASPLRTLAMLMWTKSLSRTGVMRKVILLEIFLEISLGIFLGLDTSLDLDTLLIQKRISPTLSKTLEQL